MSIAYLINQYPKVSHSFIRREILALERQGIEVSRFALRGWDAEVFNHEDNEEKIKTCYLLKDGVMSLLVASALLFLKTPVKFLSTLSFAFKIGFSQGRALPYHLIYFLEACKLIEYWKEAPPSHVHAHFGTNTAEIVMLARCLGGPSYSFTVHGPEEFDRPIALRLSEKIARSKFVVGVSSFGRSQLLRWISYEDWNKVKEIHCGLEKSFYQGVRRGDLSLVKLVCVGRLCEQKGQLLLLQATKQLLAEGVKLELTLAGDGEMRGVIEEYIEQHNLQNSIHITGWISSEEVKKEILDSRALVLPSFAEGLPVVIMEAMSLRRPVLTTFIAGIPELVIDKENGWLFPAGSVDALAKAIKECLDTSTNDLERMGDAGFNLVTERHDVDKEAIRLIELFNADSI